jgi:phytoene dehydrogenase-like protein
LNRWFKTELLRATLATDAIIGSFAPPSHPGSAYVLLHHVMGEAGGARGVWGYVQGGMGELSHAIVKSSPDVSINLNTPVQKIITENNEVRGLCLDGVKGLPFDIVVSSVDANLTFNKLLAEDTLPREFSDEVNKIDYSSASARVNLALTELPKFDGYGDEVCRGTIHISPSLEYIERAYFDAAVDGKISEKPILEITIPTAVDDTIAPSGKHIMSIFVQYMPYKLKDDDWDCSATRAKLLENCISVLEDYVPNIRRIIDHTHTLAPADLERTYGITGGNIFQGAMSLSKLFMGRPVFGWSDYRTPINGLYMCGAATHPGGGVMGLAGKNAAREIIRDL